MNITKRVRELLIRIKGNDEKKNEAFPFFMQQYKHECGSVCLQMAAKYYFNKDYGLPYLNRLMEIDPVEGINLFQISEAFEHLGFKTTGVKMVLQRLKITPRLPMLLYWDKSTFVMLYKIVGNKYVIANPAVGKEVVEEEAFIKYWIGDDEEQEGIALLFEPARPQTTEQFINP